MAIVREGRLAAVAGMDEIKQRAVRRLVIRFAEPVDPARLTGVRGVREVHGQGTELTVVTEGSMDPLVKALAQHEVASLVSSELDLEDVFMSYFREKP